MDWTTCKRKKLVKQAKTDKNLISALLKSSENKFKTQERLPLDDTTAASKISLSYDALRELLEALAIRKGFKVYNHECYCAFLKEILNASKLGSNFDNFRKLRNAINYYGKDISAKEAEAVLAEIKDFIKEIKDAYFS